MTLQKFGNKLEAKTIKIFDYLKNSFAVTTDDGEIIFKEIENSFNISQTVILDFSGLEIIISTFFNAAIGQLYGKYTGDFLKDNLILTNISNEDLTILIKVIERAKQYFKDQQRFEKTINPNIDNGESGNKD